MNRGALIIRCIYEKDGRTAEQILNESFQFFLQRELAILVNAHDNHV
jgi:hypothetical protein